MIENSIKLINVIVEIKNEILSIVNQVKIKLAKLAFHFVLFGLPYVYIYPLLMNPS